MSVKRIDTTEKSKSLVNTYKDAKYNPVLLNEPRTSITKLILLGAPSPNFPDVKETPTFVHPHSKKPIYPLVGRIINRVIMRSYRVADDDGKIDFSIPPLCYSHDGFGTHPSPELTNPYSDICYTYKKKKGKVTLTKTCEYGKGEDENGKNHAGECLETSYLLMLLKNAKGFPELFWVPFKKFRSTMVGWWMMDELKPRMEHFNASPHDFVVEISLEKKPYKNENGEIRYPVKPIFKIIGEYDPNAAVQEGVELLRSEEENLLVPFLRGVNDY